ncbi:MAG: hypothetical protein ACLU4J_23940 [Butyricimonas paravirosa]
MALCCRIYFITRHCGGIHWRVAKQDVMNTPIQMAQGYAVLVLSNGRR